MNSKELSGGVDPSALDDESETCREDGPPLRDFFWDKVVLFLSSAIVALTAVDILTELLRGGSSIVCYVPAEFNVSDGQEAFTNSFCAQSVPDTQYLPIFVLIHGILIAAWHYIWRSSFSADLSLFLSLAGELNKLDDETTGSYPLRNLSIISKLESEFNPYSRRQIFTYYQFKLLAQLVIALISLLSTAFVFTEFDVNFTCPQQGTDMATWPFPGQVVNCIFVSLRLFALVRVFDILLLVFIILALVWGLMWTLWRHPDQLGYRNVALFSFTTGLHSSFFVPRPMLLNPAAFCRGFFSRRILQELRLRFLTPSIATDLDFLLLTLYRTESSLAHSFKEGQVLMEYKALVDVDQQIVLYKNYSEADRQSNNELEKEHLAKIKIGWSIPKKMRTFKPLNRDETLLIPDNIRGAVLGLCQRAPGNDRAIDIAFGSQGFSTVLARIFKLVGSVNFDPGYKSDETQSSLEVIKYPINITALRCHDDLFSRDSDAFIEFSGRAKALWDKASKRDYYKISLMVVGPISQLNHIATVKNLLDRWKYRFSDKAVLVVVQPVKVENGNGKKQFHGFTPPTRLFKYFDPNVSIVSHHLDWPDFKESVAATSPSPSVSSFSAAPLQAPPTAQVFHLQCGNTSCDFRLSTFEFVWDESEELEESLSESSVTSDDDECVSSNGDLQDTTKLTDLPQDTAKSTAKHTDLQDTAELKAHCGAAKLYNTEKGVVVKKRDTSDIIIEMTESAK